MTLTLHYCDDEPDIRELVAMALDMDGRIALTVHESGEALVEAVRGGARPDGFLLDVMMPGIDGPETLSRLRELPGGDAPALFFTAHARSEERERLLALGARGVLTKPFDPIQLADDILAELEPVR